MSKIIALDAGHGMTTAGKRTPVFTTGQYTGTFMHEREFNKAVVNYMIPLLELNGYQPLNVAESDNDVPLTTRTNLANNTIKNKYNKQADMYLSVHANAFTGVWQSACGIETYIMQGLLASKGNTYNLGTIIHKHLMKVANGTMKNRGLKENNYHVLRETNMSAVLVECGFMDNFNDAMLLKSEAYRLECAKRLVAAICEYYGTTYVETAQTAPSTPTTPPVNNTSPTTQQNNNQAKTIEVYDVNVFLNEKQIGVGLLHDGTSYMPVRVLCNALGVTDIVWDGNTRSVYLKY